MGFILLTACSKNNQNRNCYQCTSDGYTNGGTNPHLNFDTCSNDGINHTIPYTLPNGNDWVLTCVKK